MRLFRADPNQANHVPLRRHRRNLGHATELVSDTASADSRLTGDAVSDTSCGPAQWSPIMGSRATSAQALIDLPVRDGLLALDEETVILGVEDGALDVIAREAADRFE
jgi:hypothetical protein